MHDHRPESVDEPGPIIAEHAVAGTPERVYRALTDPAQLDEWWRELGAGVHWEMDLRPGAHWRASGRDDYVGEYEMHGEILGAEPPRWLECTWIETSTARPAPVSSVVRYEVSPSPSGAVVRVTQTGVMDAAKREQYRAGWPGALAALGRFVGRPATDHEQTPSIRA